MVREFQKSIYGNYVLTDHKSATLGAAHTDEPADGLH